MKTVYLVTLENSYQVSILQNALEEEGIESYIKNEILSSVMSIQEFQIEVEVPEKDYQKAREIVKKAFPYLVNE